MARYTNDSDFTGSKAAVFVLAELAARGLSKPHKFTTPSESLDRAFYFIDNKKEMPQNHNKRSEEMMYFGNQLENFILKESCLKIGIENLNLSHEKAFTHPDIPMKVSLDGSAEGKGLVVQHDEDAGIFVMDDHEIKLDGLGVLEAKNTEKFPFESPPLELGVIQLQAQMMCTGAKWGALCVMFRGNCLRVFLFKPHIEFQDLIEQSALDWDRRISKYKLTGEKEWYEPVNIDDLAKTSDSQSTKNEVDLSNLVDISDKVSLIYSSKQEIGRLKEVIKESEFQVMKAMDNSERAVCGKYEIGWGFRHIKAKPSVLLPSVEAKIERAKSLRIREIDLS
jgi:hypothetical protein